MLVRTNIIDNVDERRS